MTHAAGRDVPHQKRPRRFGADSPARAAKREGRIAMGDGKSFPSHGVVALDGVGGEVTRSRTNHKPRGVAGDDGRLHKEDGGSSGRRDGVRTEPKRPPFCLLFDDMDEDPVRGVYIVPNPPEGAFFVRCFGLSMGFGYPMRAVTLFERQQASLFGDVHPPSPRQARRRAAGEP